MSTEKIALVTGYTGESGKALVKELIKNNQFKKIILVGRRKIDYTENEYKDKTVLYYEIIVGNFPNVHLGTTCNRF